MRLEPPTSPPSAGIDSSTTSQAPASEAPSNGPVAVVQSAKPVKAPKPTATPKPKPTACRGTIPSSITALEGPLRHPIGSITTASVWYVVDGDAIRRSNGDYVRLIGRLSFVNNVREDDN